MTGLDSPPGAASAASINGNTPQWIVPSSPLSSRTPGGAAEVSIDPAITARVRAHVAGLLADRVGRDDSSGADELSAADRARLVAEFTDAALENEARQALHAGEAPLSAVEETAIRRAVADSLTGMGGLQPLLDDERIENIFINGCDQVFVRFTDRTGAQLGPVADSDAELIELVRMIAARAGNEERRFDRASPRLSVQLPGGARLFAIMEVSRRPSITIRRHGFTTVRLADLVANATVPAPLADFLAAAVHARLNILISGGTDAGKTTFLRSLASVIQPWERLITAEDVYELGLDVDRHAHPNVVALQSRDANVEGHGEITVAQLVHDALRMSAERVIVGEVRGAEVVPMLNAMSQGKNGSMGTIHASSSREAFLKLATYATQTVERLPFEATNLLIASAVHLVVHLDFTADRRRVVSSIREVVGVEGQQVLSNEIFEPGPDRRAQPAAPLRTETLHTLMRHGFNPDALHQPDQWSPS